jgi:transcriptional regulator LmrA/YxaF-like protein
VPGGRGRDLGRYRRHGDRGGQGGCPLGSLGGQLAETDDDARDLIAAGFDRWSTAIGEGLKTRADVGLPVGVTADDLAVALLAVLQGGLLLTQARRDTRPLEIALDTLLALLSGREPELFPGRQLRLRGWPHEDLVDGHAPGTGDRVASRDLTGPLSSALPTLGHTDGTAPEQPSPAEARRTL